MNTQLGTPYHHQVLFRIFFFHFNALSGFYNQRHRAVITSHFSRHDITVFYIWQHRLRDNKIINAPANVFLSLTKSLVPPAVTDFIRTQMPKSVYKTTSQKRGHPVNFFLSIPRSFVVILFWTSNVDRLMSNIKITTCYYRFFSLKTCEVCCKIFVPHLPVFKPSKIAT